MPWKDLEDFKARDSNTNHGLSHHKEPLSPPSQETAAESYVAGSNAQAKGPPVLFCPIPGKLSPGGEWVCPRLCTWEGLMGWGGAQIHPPLSCAASYSGQSRWPWTDPACGFPREESYPPCPGTPFLHGPQPPRLLDRDPRSVLLPTGSKFMAPETPVLLAALLELQVRVWWKPIRVSGGPHSRQNKCSWVPPWLILRRTTWAQTTSWADTCQKQPV